MDAKPDPRRDDSELFDESGEPDIFDQPDLTAEAEADRAAEEDYKAGRVVPHEKVVEAQDLGNA